MKNAGGTWQQAARPNGDGILCCVAFQCTFWSIRKQARVSSLAIPSGAVLGDVLGTDFHYSRVRGEQQTKPTERQAWCILFAEQLTLEPSNKKYFRSCITSDKNPTHLPYACVLTLASHICDM